MADLLQPVNHRMEEERPRTGGIKGEWSVAERKTFMEYLCNKRSKGGSKGSSGILDGMLFSGNLFSSVKKISFRQTNILQYVASGSLIGYKTGRAL